MRIITAVAYSDKFVEICAIWAYWEGLPEQQRKDLIEKARYWLYYTGPTVDPEKSGDAAFRASVIATAGITGKPEEKNDDNQSA